MNPIPLLALLAGMAIAMQSVMNAQLGVLLKSALIGTVIAFTLSGLLTLVIVLLTANEFPSLATINTVPKYLWFSGAILSTFGVATIYYLIPTMGAGSIMSYALSGQILTALVASHFGWFDLPVKPLSIYKSIGVIALITGLFLINWEPLHES